MEALIQNLNELVSQNQILSTVAGGSVIVWLVSNIRRIWDSVVRAVTSLISFEIVNVIEDSRSTGGFCYIKQRAFDTIVTSSKTLWERTKNLDLQASSKHELSRTYGFSVRVVFGKLVFCNRSINQNQKITINTNLRVFFASKEKFLKMLELGIEETQKEILKEESKRERDNILVYAYDGCGRETTSVKFKRFADSVFSNDNAHAKLINSVKEFIGNKDLYRKMSYPYSFSALLYGKPGCGKSSTILALASELNRDVIYVNPAKMSLNSAVEFMNCSACVIVFEDIDAINTAVSENRENGKNGGKPSVDCENGISLSDILNLTDGLLTTDGSIFLFTTNHIENLDPALLRKGRMNELVEFGYFNPETANRMIHKHLGYNIKGLKDGIFPPDLQEMIFRIKVGSASKEDLIEKFCVKEEKQ